MKSPLGLVSLKSPHRSTRCLHRRRQRRAGEPPAPDRRAIGTALAKELDQAKRGVERRASQGRLRVLTSAPAQPMGLVDRLDPLQSALELLLPEPKARRVPLRRVGIGAVPEIVGNDSLLEQLFHNLCLNAIEP